MEWKLWRSCTTATTTASWEVWTTTRSPSTSFTFIQWRWTIRTIWWSLCRCRRFLRCTWRWRPRWCNCREISNTRRSSRGYKYWRWCHWCHSMIFWRSRLYLPHHPNFSSQAINVFAWVHWHQYLLQYPRHFRNWVQGPLAYEPAEHALRWLSGIEDWQSFASFPPDVNFVPSAV